VVTAAAEAFGGGVAGFAIGRLGNGGHLHRYGRYLHLDERDLRLGRYLFERLADAWWSSHASSPFFDRGRDCSRARTRWFVLGGKQPFFETVTSQSMSQATAALALASARSGLEARRHSRIVNGDPNRATELDKPRSDCVSAPECVRR